jgi:hypothetical protein
VANTREVRLFSKPLLIESQKYVNVPEEKSAELRGIGLR